MIPVWLKIEAEERGKRFRFWLPLPVIYLLLLPLVLLLLLIAALTCVLRGINPLRPIRAFFILLCSVSGTHVEVRQADSSFLFSIV